MNMLFDHSVLCWLLFMNMGTPAFDYKTDNVYAAKSGRINVCTVGEVSDDDIVKLHNFYGNGVSFRWAVLADDQKIQALLYKAGMRKSADYPVMMLSLDRVSEVEYKPLIRLEEVPLNNAAFVKTFNAAYQITAEYQNDIVDFGKDVLARTGSDPIHCYVGYYDNNPVSVCMAVDHDDSITLHAIATDLFYRNKGCGFAITHKALCDAKKRGIKQAWLTATAMAIPLYEKLGFTKEAVVSFYDKKKEQ